MGMSKKLKEQSVSSPQKFSSLAASRHVWTIAVMAANDGVYYFGKTSLNASFDQLWDKYHYHSGWRSELVGWNTRTGKWNEQMRKSRSLARPKNANRFYTDSAHLRESERPFGIHHPGEGKPAVKIIGWKDIDNFKFRKAKSDWNGMVLNRNRKIILEISANVAQGTFPSWR